MDELTWFLPGWPLPFGELVLFGTLLLGGLLGGELVRRGAALLAAYAQSLAAWLLHERAREPLAAVYQVNAYNRFEACRFGYLGKLVDPYARRVRGIAEDILDTAAAVMPQAARLGCVDAVRALAEDVRRGYSDAGWLRARLAATGSLADVVREASELWTARLN